MAPCVVLFMCIFTKKEEGIFVLCWEKKSEGMMAVMCDDDWEDEEGFGVFHHSI